MAFLLFLSSPPGNLPKVRLLLITQTAPFLTVLNCEVTKPRTTQGTEFPCALGASLVPCGTCSSGQIFAWRKLGVLVPISSGLYISSLIANFKVDLDFVIVWPSIFLCFSFPSSLLILLSTWVQVTRLEALRSVPKNVLISVYGKMLHFVAGSWYDGLAAPWRGLSLLLSLLGLSVPRLGWNT